MKSIFQLLIVTTFISQSLAQQKINYYGFNPAFAYYPSDLIQTSKGEIIMTGDMYSSEPLIENNVTHKYMVQTDLSGDTITTKTYRHDDYGSAAILETSSTDLLTYGSMGAGYDCVGIFVTSPYSNFALQRYNSVLDSLSTSNTDVNCDDYILDFTLNKAGNLAVLTQSSGYAGATSTHLDLIDVNGNLSHISLGSTYLSEIQNLSNGYLAAHTDKIIKFSAAGNMEWQYPLTPLNYLKDFLLDTSSNLILLNSKSDTADIIKMDTLTNVIWTKKVDFNTNAILQHSNGSYVVTGNKGDSIITMGMDYNGIELWRNSNGLIMKAFGLKSIELKNGALATLGYAGGFGLPTQYVLIIDSSLIQSGSSKVEPIKKSPFNLFPNPGHDKFQIDLGKLTPEVSIRITDMQNRLIKEVHAGDVQKVVLELKEKSGIYFIQVISGNQEIEVIRYVKQNE